MRPPRGTTTAAATLTTAALLALAGCGGNEPAAAPATSPAAAPSTAAVPTGEREGQPDAQGTPGGAPPAPPSPSSEAFPPDSGQVGNGPPTLPAPQDPAAARVAGYGYELRVTGASPAGVLTMGERRFAPAPGQRLHILSFELDTSDQDRLGLLGPRLGEGPPAAALVVDGRRIPVQLLAEDGPAYLVLSAPTDARVVSLELGARPGVAGQPPQALDARTGVRLPGAPELLYRRGAPEGLTSAVDRSFPLRYTRTYDGVEGSEQAFNVRVGKAQLSPWLPAGEDGLRPAEPGRAFLVLPVNDRGGFGSQLEVPASRWRLAYAGAPAGGAQGREWQSPARLSGNSRLIWWEVPATLTEATATLAPGCFTERSGQFSFDFDFGDKSVVLPLSFPMR